MHPRRLLGVLCLVVVSLCLGCGPLGPFAGGRLRGEIGPSAVTDWSAVAARRTLQLETNPADPHSVNTWFVAMGPVLYLPTSMIRGPKDPSERGWVANVTADPLVRIRLDGRVYERRLERVGAGSEYDSARAALELKYELDPDERDPEREVWIYRLAPRS